MIALSLLLPQQQLHYIKVGKGSIAYMCDVCGGTETFIVVKISMVNHIMHMHIVHMHTLH